MNKHLKIVLQKMCDIVGADFDSLDFQNDAWYYKHSWTVEQEKEFEQWLYNYLWKSKQARKTILAYPYQDKHKIKEAVYQFTLYYGWRNDN